MSHALYRSAQELKGFSVRSTSSMPEPTGVLMCPPDFYNVVEVKNPYMAEHIGGVNRRVAQEQWRELKAGFERAGKPVSLIEAVPGLEDMVFCANQTLVGVSPRMERVCFLSSMRHPSRRKEVDAFEVWMAKAGYRIARLKEKGVYFEGGGDAIWHPGKRLLWGGYGFRSDAEAYAEVARAFEAPVVLLKLVNARFYHLDTCFCPLSPEAVLIYPMAFDPESLGLILKLFPVVLVAEEGEATRQLACNAAVVGAKTVLIQKGAAAAARHMRALGLDVVEVDTSEFIKSGGSAYCMKMFLY